MDVYLIPTTTPARYELYYEAADDEVVDAGDGHGFIDRMKQRFAEMLHEAEEWRHRRHERQTGPVSLLTKLRRKVMGFVVERIAEQRLLWHLRKADEVCAAIPTDLTEHEANAIVRKGLKKDSDHHLRWMFIDLLLLIASAPLMIIPGPNVPGFYFTFQVVGHFLSWRGAQRGLAGAAWTFTPNDDLSQLRDAMTLAPPHRQRRFHEIADRLRLEHLATFCEDVAAPSA
jgi:hypothetical protein